MIIVFEEDVKVIEGNTVLGFIQEIYISADGKKAIVNVTPNFIAGIESAGILYKYGFEVTIRDFRKLDKITGEPKEWLYPEGEDGE